MIGVTIVAAAGDNGVMTSNPVSPPTCYRGYQPQFPASRWGSRLLPLDRSLTETSPATHSRHHFFPPLIRHPAIYRFQLARSLCSLSLSLSLSALSFPCSPYVLAVGATMGIESGVAETVCMSDKGGIITSGGGFSNYYPTPAWQAAQVRGRVGGGTC